MDVKLTAWPLDEGPPGRSMSNQVGSAGGRFEALDAGGAVFLIQQVEV